MGWALHWPHSSKGPLLSLSSTSHWEANSFLSTVSQNALGAFSPSRRSSGVTARRGREGVRARASMQIERL